MQVIIKKIIGSAVFKQEKASESCTFLKPVTEGAGRTVCDCISILTGGKECQRPSTLFDQIILLKFSGKGGRKIRKVHHLFGITDTVRPITKIGITFFKTNIYKGEIT